MQGVFPAIVTPMDASGHFDEPAFRAVMQSNIDAGAHGFWVSGGTGESVLVDDDENTRIAAAAVQQAGDQAEIIMHVGASTTRRAAALAERAAAVGVQNICCVPPFFYDVPETAIVEHYRTVASATGLPLFVYNLPQFTGVNISVDLARRIKDAVPQFIGIKHSGPTLADVRDFADMELACFVGNSELMLPALTLGACGCIDGPLNIAPELWVSIWTAFRNGDLAAAMAAQQRATGLTRAVIDFGFPGCVKAAIKVRLGIDCGDPRPPLPAVDLAQHGEIEQRLTALGLHVGQTGSTAGQ